MAIVKPFIAARRFNTTAAAGTGTGVGYNILATATTNDAGAPATAFPTAPAYCKLIQDEYADNPYRIGLSAFFVIKLVKYLFTSTPIIILIKFICFEC